MIVIAFTRPVKTQLKQKFYHRMGGDHKIMPSAEELSVIDIFCERVFFKERSSMVQGMVIYTRIFREN